MKAFNDALDKAEKELPKEYDFEALIKARQAVWDAHPLAGDVPEAYADEMLQNAADPLKEVDEELNDHAFKSDAHWGLLIYWVAYGDDAAWERMLGLLNDCIDFIEPQPANRHLYRRHRFEVVNDKSQLEGATMDQLHDKFYKWVIDEYRRNCKEDTRPSVEQFEADEEGKKFGYSGGTRYNFFLIIDEICLESMDQSYGPVVKLVQRAGFGGESYSAEEIEKLGRREEDSVWDGGVTDDEFENVGWMYIDVDDYVAFEERLSDPGNWED